MKAHALLGLLFAAPAFIAAPAIAQTAPAVEARSVDQAAKAALELCVEHTRTEDAIVSKNAKVMEARGLLYQRDPPEFLASTRSSVLGIGQYAKSPSTTGEIWAIGYDSSGCMVVTLGAPVADVEKGYAEFFAQAKNWRSGRAPNPKEGERTQLYGWSPNRNTRLSAQISLRDADNVSTVTVTRGDK